MKIFKRIRNFISFIKDDLTLKLLYYDLFLNHEQEDTQMIYILIHQKYYEEKVIQQEFLIVL